MIDCVRQSKLTLPCSMQLLDFSPKDLFRRESLRSEVLHNEIDASSSALLEHETGAWEA